MTGIVQSDPSQYYNAVQNIMGHSAVQPVSQRSKVLEQLVKQYQFRPYDLGGATQGGQFNPTIPSSGGSSGGSYSAPSGKGVQRWAPLVSQLLRELGQPQSLLQTTLRRMQQESGGNERAINNWDSNAKKGTPSKGLMQTIDPTFNSYAGKYRSAGVYDPRANIYASMRYAMSRYGSLANAYNRHGGY